MPRFGQSAQFGQNLSDITYTVTLCGLGMSVLLVNFVKSAVRSSASVFSSFRLDSSTTFPTRLISNTFWANGEMLMHSMDRYHGLLVCQRKIDCHFSLLYPKAKA
jgi:hypothetical protein